VISAPWLPMEVVVGCCSTVTSITVLFRRGLVDVGQSGGENRIVNNLTTLVSSFHDIVPPPAWFRPFNV
jgi:hypothetical protein